MAQISREEYIQRFGDPSVPDRSRVRRVGEQRNSGPTDQRSGPVIVTNASDQRAISDELIRQAEEQASRISERSAQGPYSIVGPGINSQDRNGVIVQTLSPDYRGPVGSNTVASPYAQERQRLELAQSLSAVEPLEAYSGVRDAQVALEEHLNLPRGSVDPGIAVRTGEFMDALGLSADKALPLAVAERQIGTPEDVSRPQRNAQQRAWLDVAMNSGVLPQIEQATEMTGLVREINQQINSGNQGTSAPIQGSSDARLRQLSRGETAVLSALTGGGRKVGVGQKNAFNREPGVLNEGNTGIPLLLGEATERVLAGRGKDRGPVWSQELNGGKGGFVLQPATIAVPQVNRDYASAYRELWLTANRGNPDAPETQQARAVIANMAANPEFDRWPGGGTWSDGTPQKATVKEQRAFDPRLVQLGVVNPMAVIDDPSYSYRTPRPTKEQTGGYELAGVPTPEPMDFSVDENGRTLIHGFSDREDPYVQGMEYAQPTVAQAVQEIITTGRTPVKTYTAFAPAGAEPPDLQTYITQRASLESTDPRTQNMVVRNGGQLHVAYETPGRDPRTGNQVVSYKLGPAIYPLGEPQSVDANGVVTQSYRVGHPYEITDEAFGEFGNLMNQAAGPTLGGGDWRVLVNEKLRDPRLNSAQYQMLREAVGDDLLSKPSFTGDWPAQRVERAGDASVQGRSVRFPGDNPLYTIAKAIAGYSGNAPDDSTPPPLAESRDSRDYQSLQQSLEPRLRSVFASEVDIARQARMKPIPAAVASSTNSALNAPIAPSTIGNDQRQMTSNNAATLAAAPEPFTVPQHSMGPNLREMLNQDYGSDDGTRGPGYNPESYGIGAQPMSRAERPAGGLLDPTTPRQQSYEPPGNAERPEYSANRGASNPARPMSDERDVRDVQDMRDFLYGQELARAQRDGMPRQVAESRVSPGAVLSRYLRAMRG